MVAISKKSEDCGKRYSILYKQVKKDVMEKTQHSALNVEVIDENFYMPQLDRNRRIWVYRPTGYYQTVKRYPVIYMHDGQNLFDEANAFGEEWGIDETLNTVLGECIIVGIDNSEHRMREYNFHDHEEFGAGEGRKYTEFITQTLKPVIDLNFRTVPDRKHTHIAGSSMGGLISLYAALYYPETFGGAGVFSPSLWIVPGFEEELERVAASNAKFPQQFYFYGGDKEGCNMTENITTVAALLKQYPHCSVDVDINPEGEHSEYHWRNKFADYYSWLSHKDSLQLNVAHKNISRQPKTHGTKNRLFRR
ncbi:MAG TPA: alpha/beta hydrolase-fold protein [Segetibacter sp.]